MGRTGRKNPITICDLCFAPLRNSRRKYGRLPENLMLLQSDGVVLPFADDSFDIVATHGLLDCVGNRDWRAISRECLRVVGDSGRVMHSIGISGNALQNVLYLPFRVVDMIGTGVWIYDRCVTDYRDEFQREGWIVDCVENSREQMTTFLLGRL